MSAVRNEKGLTLVELLAVIVILAIIAIIAVVSISQVMKNARADTHLANAQNVLEVGKMAYAVDEPPKGELFGGQPTYPLRQLSDMGYLSDAINSPTSFSWWEDKNDMYDLDKSLVVVDKSTDPPIFKINLNIGGLNFIFDNPLTKEEINRDGFTEEMKTQLGIK